jgi:hypothetical protein
MILAGVFLALAVVGCKGSSSSDSAPAASASAAAKVGASCDKVSTLSVCSNYSGTLLAGGDKAVEMQCRSLGGTFTNAACPNTSVVGRCVMTTGEERLYYATGGSSFTDATAKSHCQSLFGRWAAP